MSSSAVLILAMIGLGNVLVSQAASVTFTNSQRLLFDTDGRQLNAFGAKINHESKGTYWFYGNGATAGINLYSSPDLVNWKAEGVMDWQGGSRPHIIYNPVTQRYVGWADTDVPGYSVASSSRPDRGYTDAPAATVAYQNDPNWMSGDVGVEAFGNKAYIVWSMLSFSSTQAGSIWPAIMQSTHISELTPDFMNLAGETFTISSPLNDLIDNQLESPDIFMRNGTIYVAASNSCALCSGSIGVILRSQSIQGPWKRDIISGNACGGQFEGILTLTDPTTNASTYVWHSSTVPGGPRTAWAGHIFQPLQFNADGSVRDLDCASEAAFTVQFTSGVGAPHAGRALMASDGSPRFAAYEPVCDSDTFITLHQTWRASKSGTLTEVAVNLAQGGQLTRFQIVVFRFSTVSELMSPGYKYTVLGQTTVAASDMSYSFNTTSVLLNVTVKEGDMLGFSIGEAFTGGFNTGNNFTPYCHLEYSTADAASGMVLIQQGSGQTSPRGIMQDGRPVPPIEIRKGRGIKFLAVVV
ncbi:glycosyl hydrolase [Cladorrhinum sp. PSN259]|nr:glycosyl hydrolase [Cladorrhinum sp. PSN259]